MAKLTKKQQKEIESYSNVEIMLDDKGREYVYNYVYGCRAIDYSPWIIWKIKEAKLGNWVSGKVEDWRKANA